MKTLTAAAALYGLVSQSKAHFAVGHLLVNGTDTGLWKNVLEVANAYHDYPADVHFPQIVPQYAVDLFTSNITCGRLAFNSLNKTEPATVIAGQEIGFRTMTAAEVNTGGGYYYFSHPGAAQVWLSRAPNDDLKTYHGDGDWFKVAYTGPKSDTEWKLFNAHDGFITDFNFTLPKTTPAGKYLMRFEYLYPTSRYNYMQWFINCALVDLLSPPGTVAGRPTGFAKHPGAYKVDDPGIWVPFNQDLDMLPSEQMRLMSYKPPGPPVWTG